MPHEITIRAVSKEEFPAVKHMINLAFSKNGEIREHGFFRQFQYRDFISEEAVWALFEDNQPASALMWVPFEITIGDACFHTVGLTGVATHPDKRHRHYAYLLIERLHQYLKQKGFHGAVLHSAADHLYRKLGYEAAFQSIYVNLFVDAIKGTNQIDQAYQINQITKIYDKSSIHSLDLQLINELVELRAISHDFTKRIVKIERTLESFYQKLLELVDQESKLLVVTDSSQNSIPIAYSIFTISTQEPDIEAHKIEIQELYAISTEILQKVLPKILQQLTSYVSAIGHIKICTYFTDEIYTQALNNNWKIKESLLTGNMITFFSLEEILKSLLPTFTKRLSTPQSLQTKKNISFQLHITECPISYHSHTRFLFQILNNHPMLEIVQSDQKESNSDFLIEWKWEFFIPSLLGNVEIEDIEDEIEIYRIRSNDREQLSSNQDRLEIIQVLTTLFPHVFPVWDYFEMY